MNQVNPVNPLPRPTRILFPEIADINYVRGELAAAIAAGAIVVQGRLEGRAATPVVNEVVRFYLDLIGNIAAPANPRLLVLILMAQLETNLIETGHLNAPPDAQRSSAIVGHRLLIERFSAEPTAGNAEPTPLQVRRLLAAAVELLNLGLLSDVLHSGAMNGAIWLDGAGDFCSALSREAQTAYQRFVARMTTSTGRVRDEIEAVRRQPPDHTIEAEFGVNWDEFFALSNALRDFPDENMGAYAAEHAWFLENLSVTTGIARGRVQAWLDALSLAPRASYLQTQFPFDMNDVMPWRFNRRLSYFRKPLVFVDSPGRREVAWSLEHFRTATAGIVSDILRGAFRGVSQELERWMSGIRGENGELLNDQIADMLTTSLDGITVRRRVDTFGGVRMARPNSDLIGDVDVLAVDPGARLIVLIETKDFRASLLPSTLRDEIDDLEDAIGHVRERTAWVRAHLSEVAAELGIQPGDINNWAIHPRIVTDEPVAAAGVRDWSVEIITFDDLLALVNEGVLA